MTPDPRFLSHVEPLLARRPEALWVGPELAWVGWGRRHRLDPGTGPDRFARALSLLRGTGSPVGLASFTFDEEANGSVLVVPEVLIRVDGGGPQSVHGDEEGIPPPQPGNGLPPGRVVEQPAHRWRRAVEAALDAIERGEMEKVVLSRTARVHCAAEIPVAEVAGRLLGDRDSRTFLVEGLVGSSPELLVSLIGGEMHSVCLAGSADPGDPGAVSALGRDKTLREHALAADSVHEALAPFSPDLRRSEVGMATFGEVSHLATRFQGRAGAGTTVADVLASLHPTAAVAGTPTKSALELIRELEAHERGRYAGPVGWLDRHGEGEFAIALRCGLIEGSAATLYAGAGVVAGSDPRLELEETRIKLRPMTRALGVG